MEADENLNELDPRYYNKKRYSIADVETAVEDLLHNGWRAQWSGPQKRLSVSRCISEVRFRQAIMRRLEEMHRD